MPSLDIFTLDVVTAINMLLAGIAMLLVHNLNTGCRGLRRCVAACGILFVGFALYGLRGVYTGKLMTLLSNIPLFAGSLFLIDGILAFREMRRPTWVYVLLCLGFLGGFGWFLWVDESFSARIVVDAIFIGPMGLWAAAVMATNVAPRDRGPYWWTAAGFAIHGLSTIARGVAALTGTHFNLGHPVPMDYINLATVNLAGLGCAFGLSIATNLRLQRRTEQLALYDSLTSLPNRRLFEERLESAERRAFASGHRIALIYCDLDDFKGVNDTLGHEGGDRALRVVAARLSNVVGEEQCLARIGGDEFVVLMENAPGREAVQALANRLMRAAEGTIEFGGKRIGVNLSCGLALYPDDVGSVSDMIRLADAGMYMMKQHGRGPGVAALRA